MSVPNDLPRAPAHAGMLPHDPAFFPAKVEFENAVRRLLPNVVAVEHVTVDPAAGASRRFFRAKRGSPENHLFLKLMSAADYPAYAESEAIAERLPDSCAAVRACGTFRLGDADDRYIVAYPYVGARYLAATPDDLAALGHALARLHDGLRDIADRTLIAGRARARARRVDVTLRASARCRNLLDSAGIPALAAGVERVMDDPASQPLHGDLNVGNILCEHQTGRIHFLDFEDVRHSFGPPIVDIALPLERLCLLLQSESEAVSAAHALVGSYAAARGASPVGRPGALADALRTINERAVALLIERHEAGLDSSPEEWRKFGMLLRRHEERRHVLAAIERAFL